MCPRARVAKSRWIVCGLAQVPEQVCCLNQSLALERHMPATADDEMVVQGDANGGGGIFNLARHFDVGARGFRIAARMIVHQAVNSAETQ